MRTIGGGTLVCRPWQKNYPALLTIPVTIFCVRAVRGCTTLSQFIGAQLLCLVHWVEPDTELPSWSYFVFLSVFACPWRWKSNSAYSEDSREIHRLLVCLPQHKKEKRWKSFLHNLLSRFSASPQDYNPYLPLNLRYLPITVIIIMKVNIIMNLGLL